VLGQFRSLTAETYLRHCSLIPKRCNAIQTLLQLNSNNSSSCEFGRYSAVGGLGRFRAVYRGFGGINPRKYAENSTDLCGIDFQCGGISTL
jgi:hypothetical protein